MKNILFTAVLLIQQVYAQELNANQVGVNLVPNPGFEHYRKIPCAAMQDELSDYINDWFSFGGTADIFYTPVITDKDCYASTDSYASDSPGNEPPHSGDGMAMVLTENQTFTYREYLAVKLLHPLKKGRSYNVELFVSLGDYCGISTNNLGVAFTKSRDWLPGVGIITTLNPAVNEMKVIEQYDGWQKITGSFTADSNYTHLLIGNFLPKSQTLVKTLKNRGSNNYLYNPAIYFVDDVSVMEEPGDGSSPLVVDELNGRNVITQKNFEIDNEEVTIYVRDNGGEDGDSIAFYVNGTCVAPRLALRQNKTKMGTFKVKEGESIQIFYYALNLGEIPPNTAEVILVSGDKRYAYKLNADFESSDALMVTRSKADKN